MDSRIGYDEDFYAWTQDQGRLLREAKSAGVELPFDVENLAEEVESIGRREWRELREGLRQLINDLRRLQFDPAATDHEFRVSIMRRRFDIELLLDDSPSLRERIDIADLYESIREIPDQKFPADGAVDWGFPETCPFSLAQILKTDWWPANRHDLA